MSQKALRIACRHRVRQGLALLKQAGWWQAHPVSGGIIPPPVDKGGLLNAVPGTDPSKGHVYAGDGPADVMDAALKAIDIEYRREWGRPASQQELQAVWNFCFGGLSKADSWPELNVWIDDAAKVAGVPQSVILSLPQDTLKLLQQEYVYPGHGSKEERRKWENEVRFWLATARNNARVILQITGCEDAGRYLD